MLQALASDRAGLITAITKFLQMSTSSVILGLGALFVIKGDITPGGMIAGSILMGRALSPVNLVISTWKGLVSARAAYQRLGELLAKFPPRGTGMSLPAPKGDVLVENLMATVPGTQTLILRGFMLMRIMSTAWNAEPQRASRPFSRDRDGFVIAEGAWFLILEELERARARGAHIYGELAGYASTCEAYHRVRLEECGEEPARAIGRARVAVLGEVERDLAGGVGGKVSAVGLV